MVWLSNPEYLPAKMNEAALMQSAEKLGIEVERWEVHKPDDLERVFATASGIETVLVQNLALAFTLRWQIAELAARHRLPTICEDSEFIVAGGLMSYGWNMRETWGNGARYIDRILRGARPQDLPVEQVSKFELVINLKTAKAMVVTVPEALLVRADKVIE
jgi:putative ABC transport system substrate-binding protein